MSGKFDNRKKNSFIQSRPESSVETSGVSEKCKFNFHYFTDDQGAGQSFSDWNNGAGSVSLLQLISKLKNYSESPLSYWEAQRVGGGGLKVLEIYGSFPKKSDFTHPPHVPHDVLWARFRLASKVRLIGFLIPKELHNVECNTSRSRFDANTFYIVFLDKNHLFYKTEKN